jgi:phage terminase small subunit
MSFVNPRPEWASEISDNEWRFIDEYLVDLNGTSAYQRANPNVTRGSARTRASELMAKAHVCAVIERLMHERGVTRTWIIDQYARIARADITEFVTVKGGKVLVSDFSEIDPEILPLVKTVRMTEFGIELELINQKPALDRLAKLLRMEVERTEISGPDKGPIEIADAKDRLKDRLEAMAKKLAEEDGDQ